MKLCSTYIHEMVPSGYFDSPNYRIKNMGVYFLVSMICFGFDLVIHCWLVVIYDLLTVEGYFIPNIVHIYIYIYIYNELNLNK